MYCRVLKWMSTDVSEVRAASVIRAMSEPSQSQSHVTTDGQSVSQSWCRAPSRTHDQILVLYNDYCGLCPLGAPSLTRGWVCHLSEVFVMFYVVSEYLHQYIHYTL
jgi:hypothetical protein